LDNAGSYHGLFYGVQEFQDPAISQLKYAHRDARAMGALFSALGRPSVGIGKEVTKGRIRSDLHGLKKSSGPDDVVVVYFSGHGSPDGQLVTHDTLLSDPEPTALSLDDLRDDIAGVEARALILLLDCCFSGLYGASPDPGVKTLRSAGRARDISSLRKPEQRIRDLVGRGRVVMTASGPTEKAFESDYYGHGVFTQHLIRALLGTPETSTGDGVSLVSAFEYVRTSVLNDPGRVLRPAQNPLLEVRIEGGLTLPRMTPGADFREHWSERVPPPPVGGDLTGLADHDIDPKVIDGWRSAGIARLNRLQTEAIDMKGVTGGASLVVRAPTSSGKSLIGEVAVLRCAARRERAAILLPTKALVSEQYRAYSKRCEVVRYRVRRATGSIDDDIADIAAGGFEIALLTYEKFAGLVLRTPTLIDGLATVVVDEAHNLADRKRGAALELLLTRLRTSKREHRPQIVGLSAVLGADHGIDTWLGAGCLESDERPVPLTLGVVSPDGPFRYLDEENAPQGTEEYLGSADDADAMMLRLLKAREPDEKVAVFRGTRPLAYACAETLAAALGLPGDRESVGRLEHETDDRRRIVDRLRGCLDRGIAFHTSDLLEGERTIVEDAVRRPDGVSVLVSTTTLAQGVNLPVDTVVIRELEHREAGRRTPYSVAEFLNIAGRAGRAGRGRGRGRALIVAENRDDAERKWTQYVKGTPEKLTSSLADDRDLRDVVLAVCAFLHDDDRPRISAAAAADFLARSWAAHQARWSSGEEPFTHQRIEFALDGLVDLDMLRRAGRDVRLTALGRVAAFDHLRVDSVRILADVFAQMPPSAYNAESIIGALQLTMELGDIVFTGPRAANRTRDNLRSRLVPTVHPEVLDRMGATKDTATRLSRVRRTFAVISWIDGVPLSMIEAELAAASPNRSLDELGPLSGVLERTADFAAASVEIAYAVQQESHRVAYGTRETHPLNGNSPLDVLDRLLPARVQFGLPSGMAEIALHVESALPRRAYLDLIDMGYQSAAGILAAGLPALMECLGSSSDDAEMLMDAARAVTAEQE
jgi:replicative superfamily II helicase